MFTDIISYKLADGVSAEDLRTAAEDIVKIWMSHQDGFVGWEIGTTDEGFTDFVFWRDRAAADKAQANMKDIPADHPWLACYNMPTITAQKVDGIFSHKQ